MPSVKTSAVLSAFIVLLLSTDPGAAQGFDPGPRSVGVADTVGTTSVRAYRLPSWHWSRWTLDGQGQADWQSQERGPEENTSQRAALNLRPTYRGLWESEARTGRVRVAPSVSIGRSGGTRSAAGSPDEDSSRARGSVGLSGSGTLDAYVGGRTFLFVAGGGQLRHSRRSVALNRRPDRFGVGTSIGADLQVGAGWGRVRVVTPVIRALRVRERLRTVAPGATMTDAQVQAAARQLARRPGYEAVYDRPDKAFWRDVFDAVGATGEGRSPFETFYVADVLREPVGVRREGAAVRLGPTASYNGSLNREEVGGVLQERRVRERGTVGGILQARGYRNVTLQHQLGVDATVRYIHFVDSRGPLDHEVAANLEGQWLWVLADRVRLDTRLRADLRYEEDPTGQGAFQPDNRYRLASNVRVFVENSLSLVAGANVGYVHESLGPGAATTDLQAGVQFRVDYVLSRALD